jgi:nucleoside-diphosphate-sugar epimerase
MKKILVTGATGFIGKKLIDRLVKLNWNVRGTVRKISSFSKKNDLEYFVINDITTISDWSSILENIDCIIHCAGKSHEMKENNYFDCYKLINTEATKILAEQAAKVGVKRFIFLSSIKVNGEISDKFHNNKKIHSKFKFNDIPDPKDFYSLSKLEAEKRLWKISSEKGLEVVVLRLPLVYGKGVKGNLMRLVKLINYNIPLPFRNIKNQRSLIGIDNLLDLLIICINHPDASGKTFLVSDGEDLSTPQLIKFISSAMGRKTFLFPLPLFLLKFLGLIFGKRKVIDRLIESIRIDNTYTKEILNWTPKVTTEDGIRRMIQEK